MIFFAGLYGERLYIKHPSLEERIEVRKDKIEKRFRLLDSNLRTIHRKMGKAEWNRYLGKKHDDLNLLQDEISRTILDPENEILLDAAEGKTGNGLDPVLQTGCAIFKKSYISTKISLVPEIYRLSTSLEDELIKFELMVDGKKSTRTEVNELQRKNSDRRLREAAWLSETPLGEKLEERLIELIMIRNEKAREKGYSSYADFSLSLDGLSLEYLTSLLKKIHSEIQEASIDIIDNCGRELCVDDVSPWDSPYYAQNHLSRIPDEKFKKEGIIPLIEETLDYYGFPVDSLPIRLQVRDIPFGGLTMIMEPRKDVRILANPSNGRIWYETMFHEYGHALHGSLVDNESVLVAYGDPGFFWEGVACIMQEVFRRPETLRRASGATEAETREEEVVAVYKENLSLCSRIAGIVFELSLYESPSGNLDERFSKIYSEVTGLSVPSSPVWAASTFNISHPVYLQNYLLSEVMAAQVTRYYTKTHGSLADRDFLAFVVENLIEPGGKTGWTEKLETAVGSSLDPEPLLKNLEKCTLDFRSTARMGKGTPDRKS